MLTEPSEPEEFIIEQKSFTSATVNLSWKPPIPSNGPITEYIIQYASIDSYNQKSTEPVQRSTTTCHYEVSGLIAGNQYKFEVAAVNKAGEGPFSVTKPDSFYSKYTALI